MCYGDIAPKPPSTVAQAAPYMGTWQGDSVSPDGTKCLVRLEIRPSSQEPGMIAGYDARRCVNISKMSLAEMNSVNVILKAAPVASTMTGSVFAGAITFRVDNTVGSNPNVCAPVSYSVSPFGKEAVVAHWKGQGCPKSQLVLIRQGS